MNHWMTIRRSLFLQLHYCLWGWIDGTLSNNCQNKCTLPFAMGKQRFVEGTAPAPLLIISTDNSTATVVIHSRFWVCGWQRRIILVLCGRIHTTLLMSCCVGSSSNVAYLLYTAYCTYIDSDFMISRGLWKESEWCKQYGLLVVANVSQPSSR
jgi:hypothetical protein